MDQAQTAQLDAFGREVRDRRTSRGLTVRGLAAEVGVSAAYVTAIERGHNSSTNRPPVPSARVLSRLAQVLDLDLDRLLHMVAAPPTATAQDRHYLFYDLGTPSQAPLGMIDRALGQDVDHWVYIADPRIPDPENLGGRATVIRWSLGEYPYQTRHLDPGRLVDALDRAVASLDDTGLGPRVGLVIADCSAVMRWVQNAAAEVGLETSWHQQVEQVWARHFGSEPAADVCVYRQTDLQSMGLTIDQLDTALTLLEHHTHAYVLDGEAVLSGTPAVSRILDNARPAGVSDSAWNRLTTAAAPSFAH